MGLFLLTLVGARVSRRLAGSAPEFVMSPRKQLADLQVEPLAVEIADSSAHQGAMPPLSESVRLAVASDGHLFMVQEGRAELVREYSASGELLNSWQAPEVAEVFSVSDISIELGELWIADLLGGAVHSLDRETGTWTSVEIDPPAYRLAVFDSPARFVITRVTAPKLF
jgi:hypothetical protein